MFKSKYLNNRAKDLTIMKDINGNYRLNPYGADIVGTVFGVIFIILAIALMMRPFSINNLVWIVFCLGMGLPMIIFMIRLFPDSYVLVKMKHNR